MKLLEFHVEVTPDEAGDPPRSFSIQQCIPAEGAGIKQAMGRAVCIAIDVVQPHRVATPGVPDNPHEPGTQYCGNGDNTATANDDGKKAVAIQVGGGQDDLATSPPDVSHNGATMIDPGLLDQRDVPLESSQVSPTLCKARKVGGNDARTGVASLTKAVEASAFATDDPWVPRGDPVMDDKRRWQHGVTRNPVEGLPKT